MSNKIMPRLLRRMKRCLQKELLGHSDSKWLAAPETLSKSMSGKDTPEQRFDRFIDRVTVEKTGVILINKVSLVGVSVHDPIEDKEEILGIVDRWGVPLYYRFAGPGGRKAWFAQMRVGPLIGHQGKRQRIAILGGPHANNYFHWLTDIVGDFWFLRQMGFDQNDIDFYVFAGGEKKWQKEIIEILGIKSNKILRIKSMGRKKNLDLVIPYRNKNADIIPSWMAMALREEIMYKNIIGTNNRKIYLSRGDAKRRRVINEENVAQKLKNIGYEIWTLDGLSLREQQELFASSQIMVAPHGAALTNILWCSKGATVVDIFPESKATSCFNVLAMQLDLNYIPIWSKTKKGKMESSNWDDIEITDETLKKIIQANNPKESIVDFRDNSVRTS